MTGKAFNADDARSALRNAVPDLEGRERGKQIEIVNGDEWYAAGEKLKPRELVSGLLEREQHALGAGYSGLRTSGNCAWVSSEQWPDCLDCETLVQKAVRGRRMICMCNYCVDKVDGSIFEIMGRHDLTVPTARPGTTPQTGSNNANPHSPDLAQDLTAEGDLRQSLERQKRTFDLVMTASQMGTWRYTVADNICVYDENAQRLYGLTDARFLHDDAGVKQKFHPDDMELMWSRVAKALDPEGDGLYDVEYRVKQLDGSWRWLSAWGLVEFEGEGPSRKPVAITGASRDLTESKQAEEQQRLLLNELNHRVKNTLATIHAITAQTMRNARDLPSARLAVEQRIRSMAQAHDLLTMRAWTGANLTDVAARALNAFSPAQVKTDGTDIKVSPKHALALSLTLHELATNATKYGALSRPEGRVSLQWTVQDGLLQLGWKESGGPAVTPPTRKGLR